MPPFAFWNARPALGKRRPKYWTWACASAAGRPFATKSAWSVTSATGEPPESWRRPPMFFTTLSAKLFAGCHFSEGARDDVGHQHSAAGRRGVRSQGRHDLGRLSGVFPEIRPSFRLHSILKLRAAGRSPV